MPDPAEQTTMTEAIEVLRRRRASVAVVLGGAARLTGIAGLHHLLARYFRPQGA
ncbi:hypothetical protein ACFYWD_04150 [Streptomyces sp. NPDC003781]|uniref:hypothetical protein n=1 Tax=Streptomyces sp. NPDC003781 TaxID=3364686 RepID=UPI0036CD69F6